MFSYVGDNEPMAISYEHLIQSYDIADLLDDVASADPPAYLRRCFAEGNSAPSLSWHRVQQLAVCAMILDAIVNNRDYEIFEHELISDWRIHYASACVKLKDIAVQALRRVLERERPQDPEAVTELERLASSLAAV
jgi:hypothetical protein